MMSSPFVTSRIPPLVFGAGMRTTIKEHIEGVVLGAGAPPSPRVLLISGRAVASSSRFDELRHSLASGFTVDHRTVHGEPSPDQVNAIVHAGQAAPPDIVVAVGGGSTIDTGKAVAAAFSLPDPIESYLEGVGDKTPTGAKLPFVAVPTTAGTGSEATKNAVLSRTGPDGFKKSLRHDNYVPDLALVDPELTIDCPRSVTAASGLDAFTQLLEAYLSTKASVFTDTLCESGMYAFASGFPEVLADGGNVEARSAVSYAAFLSGVALATAGLGLVHGLASPIGARAPVPHGVVCGALLAPVLQASLPSIDGVALGKLARVADIIDRASGRHGPIVPAAGEPLLAAATRSRAEAALAAIEDWVGAADLPGFSEFGLDAVGARAAAAEAGHKNHPAKLDQESIKALVLGRL